MAAAGMAGAETAVAAMEVAETGAAQRANLCQSRALQVYSCWDRLASSSLKDGASNWRHTAPKPQFEKGNGSLCFGSGGGTRTPDTRIMIPLL